MCFLVIGFNKLTQVSIRKYLNNTWWNWEIFISKCKDIVLIQRWYNIILSWKNQPVQTLEAKGCIMIIFYISYMLPAYLKTSYVCKVPAGNVEAKKNHLRLHNLHPQNYWTQLCGLFILSPLVGTKLKLDRAPLLCLEQDCAAHKRRIVEVDG